MSRTFSPFVYFFSSMKKSGTINKPVMLPYGTEDFLGSEGTRGRVLSIVPEVHAFGLKHNCLEPDGDWCGSTQVEPETDKNEITGVSRVGKQLRAGGEQGVKKKRGLFFIGRCFFS